MAGAQPQVWLEKKVRRNDRGHFEMKGDCGPTRIIAEIDSALVARLGFGEPEKVLIANHSRLQEAARKKWAAGEAFDVYKSNSDEFSHKLIAISFEEFN